MPKEVDHPARRRELADAACRVIARNGLSGTTLAHVAEESGWSIGSIRYYFPNKDELLASALWRVGERVDERIERRTAGGRTMNDLRLAATELLPLDAAGARRPWSTWPSWRRRRSCPRWPTLPRGQRSGFRSRSLSGSPIWWRQASYRRTLSLRMRRRAFGCYSTGCASSSLPLPGRPRPRGRWRYWMTTSLRLPLRRLRREVARTPLPGGGADGVCAPLATVYRRAPA